MTFLVNALADGPTTKAVNIHAARNDLAGGSPRTH